MKKAKMYRCPWCFIETKGGYCSKECKDSIVAEKDIGVSHRAVLRQKEWKKKIGGN